MVVKLLYKGKIGLKRKPKINHRKVKECATNKTTLASLYCSNQGVKQHHRKNF